MSFTADLDMPLAPLNYEGQDSVFTEISGYIRLSGRRDEPHSLIFPVLAAAVFSPTTEGTNLYIRPIARSGALPTTMYYSQSMYGTSYNEEGVAILGASFSAEGAKSTYDFDYQNVVADGTLRVLIEMTANRPLNSNALAIGQMSVGSQIYLTDRPGEQRPLSLYFSTNPIPEPASILLAGLAGFSWVGRRCCRRK